MKFRVKFLLIAFTFWLIISNQGLNQTLSQVDTGWSATSVNAVVFRKNSVVSFHDTQYVAYYDSQGFLSLAKRKLETQRWEISKTNYKGNVGDAHNSISIMIDGKGYLHVAADHHNSLLHYFKGIQPGSLKLGPSMPMIGQDENMVTYPEFYRFPDGDLLFLYRSGESGNGNLVINYYSCKNSTWKRLHNILIDGQGQRNAYWQAYIDLNNIIHLSWIWRETPDVATNHDMCYALSVDKGMTWKRSTGELYDLPITQGTAEIACRIPQGSELINQTSMYADLKSQPYIATYFMTQENLIPQYQLIYLDNGFWKRSTVSDRKIPFSLSGIGTKKIPISRPQFIIEENKHNRKAFLIYRDTERRNYVSVAECDTFPKGGWKKYDLTNFSVGDWEPTYDSELWKTDQQLHLFLQHVGQGDSETETTVKPQSIYILELNDLK